MTSVPPTVQGVALAGSQQVPAALFAPLRGLRPLPDLAQGVAELPYDVMSRSEAEAMAAGRPDSFLHVSRPEIDLPGQPADCTAAYARAGSALAGLVERGVLHRDRAAQYYAYRLTRGQHVQTGVVGGASVAAYDAGRIRKHERTRPDKLADRAAHIEATGAQTGPVFLIHRRAEPIARIVARVTELPAETTVVGPGGVRHEIWPIGDPGDIAALAEQFDALAAMYIADGHHRSAAASLVHSRRPGQASAGAFLAVAFPDDEVAILAYNRVVADLNGLTADALLASLGRDLDLARSPEPVAPAQPGVVGMYLAGSWWRLRLGPTQSPTAVQRLDVWALEHRILQPILGMGDPRTDPRIGFVGGIRGLDELSRRVDSGRAAVAFSLHPTTVAQLLEVADSGEMMPPKSTWFEPKLLDGLICHQLD